MPQVFDNVNAVLLDNLRAVMAEAFAGEFCVGYFHLRGWKELEDRVEAFEGGEDKRLRILVGMTTTEQDELESSMALTPNKEFDAAEARKRQTRLMREFQGQLTKGYPTNGSIFALRRLTAQIAAEKVAVKIFTRYPLHAKLYLLERTVTNSELYGIVGSSNLTGPGLYRQGELNLDVNDQDACNKLMAWFEERWNDKFAIDVTFELQKLIATSWAREELVSPYLVYLKIVYHLAKDALSAEEEYRLPREFKDIVLDFQEKAIVRTRFYLRRFPLAILADVVGMGKTLAATGVIKLFQMEESGKCIVCCPVKLQPMWREYFQKYDIAGEVIPYSQIVKTRQGKESSTLAEISGRTRLLVLDESHNLRNRETKVWSHVRDFIRDQDCRVLLLSATPYNKHYEDLGNQLRLAIEERADLGVRPEALFREQDELEICSQIAAPPTSLMAFEQSPFPEDWTSLLSTFMVRRTRDHIVRNYGKFSEEKGRYYIELKNGTRSYFPKRVPITLGFPLDDKDANDQYGKVFNPQVVDLISHLRLPRYGLGLYVDAPQKATATDKEAQLLTDLGTARERLIGYCRINLLKRLESSGHAFQLSLERHALRNLVFVYAIDNGLDFPIGSQDSHILDTATSDSDPDSEFQAGIFDDLDDIEPGQDTVLDGEIGTGLMARAKAVYDTYDRARKAGRRHFRWISSKFFDEQLRSDLKQDAEALLGIIRSAGDWDPTRDAKVQKLAELLKSKESGHKAIVFTQFADTANYLAAELARRGVDHVEEITAATTNPHDVIRRFSPTSNHYVMQPNDKPIRVLVATEIMSEGQNCQDASVVINYDLPWAIIRLIQRAGRVDRIGQDNAEIRIYSCLPDEGVEGIIDLRGRLLNRLKVNREVIGTDESFFDEEQGSEIRNLYAEDPNALDGHSDDPGDVDLASQAEAIWQQALQADPEIEQKVKDLPNQVFATKDHASTAENPEGVLVYFKTNDGFDSLVRTDTSGKILTHSIAAVLRAAECKPDVEPLPTHQKHHGLVESAIRQTVKEHFSEVGGLGHRRSARRRVRDILNDLRTELRESKTDLFTSTDTKELDKIISDITQRNLTERARDTFNRMMREHARPEEIYDRALHLRNDNELNVQHEEVTDDQPNLICSIGLFPKGEVGK